MEKSCLPSNFAKPKHPPQTFHKSSPGPLESFTSSFHGQGDGLGHPRAQSFILGLLDAKLSFKKMNFNFNQKIIGGCPILVALLATGWGS